MSTMCLKCTRALSARGVCRQPGGCADSCCQSANKRAITGGTETVVGEAKVNGIQLATRRQMTARLTSRCRRRRRYRRRLQPLRVAAAVIGSSSTRAANCR